MTKDEIIEKWVAEFPDSKFDEDYFGGSLLVDLPSTEYIFNIEKDDDSIFIYITTKEYYEKWGYINDQNYDIIRSEETNDGYGYIHLVDTSIIEELKNMGISEYTDMESCWVFDDDEENACKIIESLKNNPRFTAVSFDGMV